MPRVKNKPRKRYDLFKPWTDTVLDCKSIFETIVKKRAEPSPRKLNRRKQNNKNKGRNVQSEIQRLKHTTNLLIAKKPFNELIQEIIRNQRKGNLRVEAEAFNALQEASESYLTLMFQALKQCAAHCGRETIMPKDLHFFLALMDLMRSGSTN